MATTKEKVAPEATEELTEAMEVLEVDAAMRSRFNTSEDLVAWVAKYRFAGKATVDPEAYINRLRTDAARIGEAKKTSSAVPIIWAAWALSANKEDLNAKALLTAYNVITKGADKSFVDFRKAVHDGTVVKAKAKADAALKAAEPTPKAKAISQVDKWDLSPALRAKVILLLEQEA